MDCGQLSCCYRRGSKHLRCRRPRPLNQMRKGGERERGIFSETTTRTTAKDLVRIARKSGAPNPRRFDSLSSPSPRPSHPSPHLGSKSEDKSSHFHRPFCLPLFFSREARKGKEGKAERTTMTLKTILSRLPHFGKKGKKGKKREERGKWAIKGGKGGGKRKGEGGGSCLRRVKKLTKEGTTVSLARSKKSRRFTESSISPRRRRRT